MRLPIIATAVFVLACVSVHAQGPVIEWTFDTAGDLEGWAASGHLEDVEVRDGALCGRAIDWDPILMPPAVDFATGPWQIVEITMWHETGGLCQVYYTNTLDTEYGGFSPGKSADFEAVGGELRTYRLRPFWQAEGRIIKLRLDVPAEGAFEIDSIRIIDMAQAAQPVEPDFAFSTDDLGWAAEDGEMSVDQGLVFTGASPASRLMAPPVDFEAEAAPLVAVRMSTTEGNVGALYFATDASNGLHAMNFALVPDGAPHTYNIELCAQAPYRGRIIALALAPTDAVGVAATVEYVRATAEPVGPADLSVTQFGLDDVINRAGDPTRLQVAIENRGGEVAKGVSTTLKLPEGISVEGDAEVALPDIEFGFPVQAEWAIRAGSPIIADAEVVVSSEGADVSARATLEFTERRLIPPTDYIPEPVATPTKYNVGVYYFPGWNDRSRWAPIEDFPERKPILGWYDESEPEIADWQIKWAVEHGISFFVVDWYWSEGGRSLEHWLHDAYMKSHYRDKLNFCLLWANHNPPGTSSLEDCLAVTQYWIDNYFKLDEYEKVDGKPVMVIFATSRLRDDLGSEGVREAFDAMDDLCRENGLPGIYMVACARSSAPELQRLADEGYDAVSGYNYPDLNSGGKPFAPYEDCIDGYAELWSEAESHGILKEIPVLNGGWDSRPWARDRARVLEGRTPELFERHLRDAKRFLDEEETLGPDLNMCIIEAWNEWGEGSYIGPHREFGFGYLDAIRNVFCDVDPKHQDLTPKDIGMGPYDFPLPANRSAWDFDDGAAQGWGAMMGLDQFRIEDGAMCAHSITRDPALSSATLALSARRLPILEMRVRASQDDEMQVFWGTSTGAESEGRSVRIAIAGDGAFHDYRVDLSENASWRGRVTRIRLDPGNEADADYGIDYIRFVEE